MESLASILGSGLSSPSTASSSSVEALVLGSISGVLEALERFFFSKHAADDTFEEAAVFVVGAAVALRRDMDRALRRSGVVAFPVVIASFPKSVPFVLRPRDRERPRALSGTVVCTEKGKQRRDVSSGLR